jgi:hypothetical protein
MVQYDAYMGSLGVKGLNFRVAAALFQASGAGTINRLQAVIPRNSYSILGTFKYFRLLINRLRAVIPRNSYSIPGTFKYFRLLINRLQAVIPRTSYSTPGLFKYFRLLISMQTNSVSHPTVMSVGNRSYFSRVNKSARGTVCSSQFTAEAKIEWNSISSMHPNGEIYL